MWLSRKGCDLKPGDRIRLTRLLTNDNSSFMPKENLPVGLQGTVTHVNEGNRTLYIHMEWDNGSKLALLETDCKCYEKIS